MSSAFSREEDKLFFFRDEQLLSSVGSKLQVAFYPHMIRIPFHPELCHFKCFPHRTTLKEAAKELTYKNGGCKIHDGSIALDSNNVWNTSFNEGITYFFRVTGIDESQFKCPHVNKSLQIVTCNELRSTFSIFK